MTTLADLNLSGFGPYLGMSHLSHLDDGAQAFLQKLQGFDPSAQWVDEGNLGENPDNHQYRLQYDISKLPENPTGNHGTFGIADVGTLMRDNGLDAVKNEGHLVNPDAVRQDSTYGYITPQQNMKNEFDWMDLGPMFVSLAAGGMGALGALTGAGGAAGMAPGAAFSSGMSGSQLPQAFLGAAKGVGSGDYLGAALSAAGPVANLAGLPSYTAPLIRAGVNAAQGNWLGAATSAAGPAAGAANLPSWLLPAAGAAANAGSNPFGSAITLANLWRNGGRP